MNNLVIFIITVAGLAHELQVDQVPVRPRLGLADSLGSSARLAGNR